MRWPRFWMRCLVAHELTGRCLCGAVHYRGLYDGDTLRACHCSQCRRWSGHIWAATGLSDFEVHGPLRWFASSDRAKRGFCGECGSAMFWKSGDRADVEVAAGTLDKPTGLSLSGHIFVADKGDYYGLADGLPQWQGGTDE